MKARNQAVRSDGTNSACGSRQTRMTSAEFGQQTISQRFEDARWDMEARSH
ncbi:MAG: hypothetical protein IT422_02930 [Pirellulaceae bacterium]|nr:hypothetical protein [Pirellulaceae bacterium]